MLTEERNKKLNRKKRKKNKKWKILIEDRRKKIFKNTCH